MSGGPCGPRIAIFTHDTFGLGHVRRCLHIVKALAERAPDAAILFITGSPALHMFKGLPPNADFVKVPTIVRTGLQSPSPSHLPLALEEVTELRARLIQEAILAFAPDVLLVDNFPLGSRQELLPMLREIRRLPTRTLLGLRDIVDAPDVVQVDWARQGIYEVLDEYYDRILVYGMREVLNVVDAYALPPGVAAKVRYCGYVTGSVPPPRAPAEVRAELRIDGPFILATGGGGGDAFPLMQTFLEAVPLMSKMPAVVCMGPLMSSFEQDTLRAQAAACPGVVLLDYVQDLPSYMDAAEVVVAMCGYNTAAEIIALRSRAIVVPRTWRYGEHANRTQCGVEWEQMLRARALAKLGLVDLLEPEALNAQGLAERIASMLENSTTRPEASVELDGLAVATDHILAMASEEEAIAHAGT